MMPSSGENESKLCVSSSSVPKLPLNNKNKSIIRPPHTTSLRSLTELLTFRSLLRLSPKSSNQNILSHDGGVPVAQRHASSSSSLSSSSAIVINYNEDLLVQILLLLPPKSLIRFQCVSKEWLSLISSSSFRGLHSQKNPTFSSSYATAEEGLFLYRRIYRNLELNSITLRNKNSNAMGMITSRFINFLKVDGEIFGFHWCNGLVLVDFYWNYEIRRYYVCNPTTNQYRLIPQPDIDEKSQRFQAMNIVFDPLKSDHYRLVCVLSKLTDEEVQSREFYFLAYSSETGVWKKYVDIGTDVNDDYYHFQQGVYWNGNLYWKNANRSLLCFDFEHDCVRKMKMARLSRYSSIILYFGESRGNLHLIELGDARASFLYILELELDLGLGRYHSKWLLKYQVDICLLVARYPLMVNERFANYDNQFVFGIPCFLLDGKENTAKLLISLRGKMFYYEINSRSFEELVEIEPANLQFLGNHMSVYCWTEAFKHFQTLACV